MKMKKIGKKVREWERKGFSEKEGEWKGEVMIGNGWKVGKIEKCIRWLCGKNLKEIDSPVMACMGKEWNESKEECKGEWEGL